MSASPTAVVLVSGGMDSCVTLATAVQSHQVAVLHASYGQRTAQRERACFEALADHYAIDRAYRRVLDISFLAAIGGSALTDSTLAIPESGLQPGVPITYVPFRNAHLLAAAVSWAEVLEAEAVYIGAVEADSSGYPDCRRAFFDAFARVIAVGTRTGSIRIETPVIEFDKSQVVRRGLELSAPLHLTWSCYQADQLACGVCESCRLRLRGFERVGVADPIPYRHQAR
jgi:7-cyano-7-deazaguanine synthase